MCSHERTATTHGGRDVSGCAGKPECGLLKGFAANAKNRAAWPAFGGLPLPDPPFPSLNAGRACTFRERFQSCSKGPFGVTRRELGAKLKDWDRIPQLLTTVDAADCTSAAGEHGQRTRVGAGGAQPERPRRVE